MARLRTRRTTEKKQLPDCAPEHCFWVRDGQILKNVQELREALKTMSDETFQHHVNSEKNDFATWIEEVFSEKQLADVVRREGTRGKLIQALHRTLY